MSTIASQRHRPGFNTGVSEGATRREHGAALGAHPFSGGTDVERPVVNFLTHALPAEDELIALD